MEINNKYEIFNNEECCICREYTVCIRYKSEREDWARLRLCLHCADEPIRCSICDYPTEERKTLKEHECPFYLIDVAPKEFCQHCKNTRIVADNEGREHIVYPNRKCEDCEKITTVYELLRQEDYPDHITKRLCKECADQPVPCYWCGNPVKDFRAGEYAYVCTRTHTEIYPRVSCEKCILLHL